VTAIPQVEIRCDECGDKFAGASAYEVHVPQAAGRCLAPQARRALGMTEIAPCLWGWPPNPAETQAMLDAFAEAARLDRGEMN